MRLGIVLPASFFHFIIGDNVFSYYVPQIFAYILTSYLVLSL